jgi:hypothetical protein
MKTLDERSSVLIMTLRILFPSEALFASASRTLQALKQARSLSTPDGGYTPPGTSHSAASLLNSS